MPFSAACIFIHNKFSPSYSKALCAVPLFPRSAPKTMRSDSGRQQTASVATSTDTIMSEQVSASQPERVTQWQRVWQRVYMCAPVCVCVCVTGITGFWQEANNRNTHFHLIGTSSRCQLINRMMRLNLIEAIRQKKLWQAGNFEHRLLRSSCEEASTDLAFMSLCDSKSCWVNETMSPVPF